MDQMVRRTQIFLWYGSYFGLLQKFPNPKSEPIVHCDSSAIEKSHKFVILFFGKLKGKDELFCFDADWDFQKKQQFFDHVADTFLFDE